MVRHRRFNRVISPSVILGLLMSMHVILMCLFLMGLLPSFRLQNKPVSLWGIAHFLLFYLLAFGMITVFEKVSSLRILRIKSIRWGNLGKHFLPTVLALTLLGIGLSGLLGVLFRIGWLPFSDYFVVGIKGGLLAEIPWGQGLTIRHVALQIVPIISLLFVRQRVIKYICFVSSIAALCLYSAIYMSRIMILAPIVAVFVLLVRKGLQQRYLWSLISVLIIITFVWQGLRDFEKMGIYYTDNILLWGIIRLTDYYVSTALFSVYVASTLPNDNFSDISSYFGAPEYVNLGSLGQLWKQFGISYFFVLTLVLFLVGHYWQKYVKGESDGLLVYPFMVYSLLEFPRIFEFTTVTGYVRLLLLILIGWLLRNVPARWII